MRETLDIKVPELRFPEFSNQWLMNTFGQVLLAIKDGTHATHADSENGEYFLLSAKNLKSGKVLITQAERMIDSATFHTIIRTFNPQKGDCLLTVVGAGIGQAALMPDLPNVCFQRSVAFLRPSDSIDSAFLYHFLVTTYAQNQFQSRQVAGAQPGLYLKDLSKISINTPILPEQQKIAEFLTAVDEKIGKLKRKKELLEAYKKGAMQMLFSQEIRFKDDQGNPYPDWEEKRLGELMSISPRRRALEINPHQILTVQLHRRGVKKNTRTETLSIGATTYYVRRAGEFVFGKQNLHRGAFDIIPQELDSFLTSGDIPCLTINQLILHPHYILNFFGRPNYYNKLEAIATGTGSKRIHEKTFLNLYLTLPSLPEQQKIAEFLTGIDHKIKAVANQIHTAAEFKKGLLQKMFV